MTASPFTETAEGLRVAIRLTPKASRDRVMGPAAEADGGVVLKATVTTVPEDGKANAALIRLLSKEWRIPKTRMGIILGATDRRKVVLISGDAAPLRLCLEQWMAKLP
ncbi:conserved hypothetical protein [Candidatus Terasakiella magnetica]|nr:conserved hypothetical protein [Candidatus Terasakiella magnetica]